MVQLPNYIDFIRLSDDRALLAGPATTKELRGESVELVEQALPLLRDGTATTDLAEKLDISMSFAEDLVERLQTTGFLKNTSKNHDYWSWAAPIIDIERSDVQEATVILFDQSSCGLSDVEDHPFDIVSIECIEDLSSVLSEADLLITITVGEDPNFHQEIMDNVSDSNIDWIPAKFSGSEVIIGPFGTKKSQGCYNCYHQRRRASTEISPSVSEVINQRSNNDQTPYSKYIHGFIIHILLTEAASALGKDKSPQTSGAIMVFDLIEFSMKCHDVIPIPGCELCGMK